MDTPYVVLGLVSLGSRCHSTSSIQATTGCRRSSSGTERGCPTLSGVRGTTRGSSRCEAILRWRTVRSSPRRRPWRSWSGSLTGRCCTTTRNGGTRDLTTERRWRTWKTRGSTQRSWSKSALEVVPFRGRRSVCLLPRDRHSKGFRPITDHTCVGDAPRPDPDMIGPFPCPGLKPGAG